MEETELQLDVSASAVFDSTGIATAFLSNNGTSRWTITNTAISTTSTAVTQCVTYRGSVSPTNQVDFTKKQGNGSSSDTQIPLSAGQILTVQWTGGTPGAVATVTVQGRYYVQGRRMY